MIKVLLAVKDPLGSREVQEKRAPKGHKEKEYATFDK